MTSDPLSRYLAQRSERLERRTRLRTMLPGEVIDLSMRIYQTLGWTILRLTALPSLLCLAAVAFVLEFFLPTFFQTSSPQSVSTQVAEAFGTLAITFGVAGPLFLVGLTLSSGVVVSIVSDAMLGNMPDPKAAVRASARSFGRMMALNLYELAIGWSGVLLGCVFLLFSLLVPETAGDQKLWPAVVTLLAFMALIAGGFTLPAILARHSLAAPAAVIEGAGPIASVRRSVQLLRGSGWHPSGYGTVWGLFCVVVFLLLMLWIGIGASMAMVDAIDKANVLIRIPVFGAVVEKALQLLPWFLAIWSVVPVWCTTATILYYERRIRLEGYDIEALARDVWRADRTSRFEL